MNASKLINDKSRLATPGIDTANLAVLVIDHYLRPLMKQSKKQNQREEIFMAEVPRYNPVCVLRWLINQPGKMEQLEEETITSVHQHAVQRMRGVFTEVDNKGYS